MRGAVKILGLGLCGLLLACGGDDGSTEDEATTAASTGSSSTGTVVPNTAPTVQAEADVGTACQVAGATRVELHATRVGCVNPPPAPCTLPNPLRATIGDGVDCPADSSPVTLRVELEAAGRYHVEVVSVAGDDVLGRVCHGVDAQAELLVESDAFDSLPTIEVTSLGGAACG